MRRRIALSLLVLAWIGLGQDARFVAIDIYVDAGDRALAAYQIEITAGDATERGTRIVGVEGGEPQCFASPPYYDPKALEGRRIIVAAFTTDPDAPRGKMRVARLHFFEERSGEIDYRAEAIAAAAPGGERIPVRIEIRPAGAK
jgi:hypothetical protein